MTNKEVNKVPPDGGYGWVVTFAYALNNAVVLPLITNFGLVFQECFDDTGMTTSQGSFIIMLNHGNGMLLSLFGGPVLRRFGYRKVAIAGAVLISGGLMLTAIMSSFWQFIFAYSILNSLGVTAVMSAFSLAINSFFKDKRGRAIGLGMSITGLGGIYMPPLMSGLLHAYGWRYAILTLGALCLHSLLGACLLRPAKWYLRDPQITEEMEPLKKENDVELINGNISTPPLVTPSIPQLEKRVVNGTLPAKSVSMKSLNSNSSIETRNAESHPDVSNKITNEKSSSETKYPWWKSQEVNLGSSFNVFSENEKKAQSNETDLNVVENDNKSYFSNLVNFFDLTLLTDPIFVNILLGLCLAASVETNFSLLFPIILKDMLSFDITDTAQIMMAIAFSDTLFRFISPFIGEWCNKSPRVMYIFSLLLIIFIRSLMLFTTSFTGMLLVALSMGVTKGARTIYMNLVIPSYVPIHRLAFASGIQMFFSGITIITIGFMMGRIRDSTGSFKAPIVALNIVTFFTIILWSAEFLLIKLRNNKPSDQTNQTEA